MTGIFNIIFEDQNTTETVRIRELGHDSIQSKIMLVSLSWICINYQEINSHAKDGGREEVWFYVVFTMILCVLT